MRNFTTGSLSSAILPTYFNTHTCWTHYKKFHTIKQKLKNNLNSIEINNYTRIKKYEILILKVSYS